MDSIRELRHLKQLEVLNLSSNIELSFDNELEELDKLIELNLEGNDLYDIGIIGGVKSLVKFHLKECEISEIKNLDQFLNLEELNLSGNSIEEIKGLEKLTRLRELKLRYYQGYSDSPITHLEGVHHLTKLERIDISGNEIQRLEKLPSERITWVNMQSNKVNYIDYDWLNSLKQPCQINPAVSLIKQDLKRVPQNVTITV